MNIRELNSQRFNLLGKLFWLNFKTKHILFFIVGVCAPLVNVFVKYNGPLSGIGYTEKGIRAWRKRIAFYLNGVCERYNSGIVGAGAPNQVIGFYSSKYFTALGIWPVIFYGDHAQSKILFNTLASTRGRYFSL